MAPFIWYGRWQAARSRFDTGGYDLVCFFPDASLGGAQKVNASVLAACTGKRVCIFFTKKGTNQLLLHLFALPNCTVYDIAAAADNKVRYWNNFIWRGRCSWLINRQRHPVTVLNCQCNFAYKLLPHLKQGVRVVELIHVAEPRFSAITFPYIPFLPVRVTVGPTLIQQHLRYYRQLGVPPQYNNAWQHRLFGVAKVVPPLRNYHLPLRVGYLGRDSREKRLGLLYAAASACGEKALPLQWHFIGVSAPGQDPVRQVPNATWHGVVENDAERQDLLQQMDLLVLTSSFEGRPLALMESMMLGVVPVATAVGCIPECIEHATTGYLLQHPDNEAAVKDQLIAVLEQLTQHPETLASLSRQAHAFACRNFTNLHEAEQWRALLFGPEE